MSTTAHAHDLSPWQHSHQFDTGNRKGEARTRWVLAITLVTMAAEIFGGWWTGSMALLADGWHMGTHALALGVATLAYALARRHASDARYTFGTWKIEVLGSFASALVLGLVAVGIVFESGMRLWKAEPLSAQTALIVALFGLVVNLVSAWLLHGADDHGHQHGAEKSAHAAHVIKHEHDDEHKREDEHKRGHDHAHANHHDHAGQHKPAARTGHDLNLRAAYVQIGRAHV